MAATKTKTKTKKPNKAKTKKPNKAKTKKPNKAKTKKATTGQSGPDVEVLFDDLNEKEQLVLKRLNGKGKGTREEMKIEDITKVFAKKAKTKAQQNSWVRNSLRRLCCGGWVEKMDRGLYRISENGRRRIIRAKK